MTLYKAFWEIRGITAVALSVVLMYEAGSSASTMPRPVSMNQGCAFRWRFLLPGADVPRTHGEQQDGKAPIPPDKPTPPVPEVAGSLRGGTDHIKSPHRLHVCGSHLPARQFSSSMPGQVSLRPLHPPKR